jgi:hypothetical protein
VQADIAAAGLTSLIEGGRTTSAFAFHRWLAGRDWRTSTSSPPLSLAVRTASGVAHIGRSAHSSRRRRANDPSCTRLDAKKGPTA